MDGWRIDRSVFVQFWCRLYSNLNVGGRRAEWWSKQNIVHKINHQKWWQLISKTFLVYDFFEIYFYEHLQWVLWNTAERVVISNQKQSNLVHFRMSFLLLMEISPTIHPFLDFVSPLISWNKNAYTNAILFWTHITFSGNGMFKEVTHLCPTEKANVKRNGDKTELRMYKWATDMMFWWCHKYVRWEVRDVFVSYTSNSRNMNQM